MQELNNLYGMEAMNTSQPVSTTMMNTEDEPLHTAVPSNDEVPGIKTIRSYVMPHSTLGNPQMNGISDSSVVDQQTVKGQEAPQHLLHPVTIPPCIDKYMYCKY
ncbi:unnamed protein product [Pocillopora meandrina]|uniref:Uncharacterized protein n=1 Tax=Pocillopora meandrina TaxID=46732 RepID=A0AAU9X4E1_9CNID|nr:unnamed protein product [Pocillopora meandrina]